MYAWRKMTAAQRASVLAERKLVGVPWHGPPRQHPDHAEYHLVTAACYEHAPVLSTTERLASFEAKLLDVFHAGGWPVAGWCVLPNHYHVLAEIGNMRGVARALGRLHGRSARDWNLEDRREGRKVWYRSQDRRMRSEDHFLNYIHNNPVRHGLVTKWQEWPFSSVHHYVEVMGRGWLAGLWRDYPLGDYGRDWDPA